MAFQQVTVTGTYKRQDGSAAAGTVEFILSATLQDSATNEIRVPVPVTVNLDANGSFSTSLVSALTAGIQPTGATYRVTERIIGATPRSYSISI